MLQLHVCRIAVCIGMQLTNIMLTPMIAINWCTEALRNAQDSVQVVCANSKTCIHTLQYTGVSAVPSAPVTRNSVCYASM